MGIIGETEQVTFVQRLSVKTKSKKLRRKKKGKSFETLLFSLLTGNLKEAQKQNAANKLNLQSKGNLFWISRKYPNTKQQN